MARRNGVSKIIERPQSERLGITDRNIASVYENVVDEWRPPDAPTGNLSWHSAANQAGLAAKGGHHVYPGESLARGFERERSAVSRKCGMIVMRDILRQSPQTILDEIGSVQLRVPVSCARERQEVRSEEHTSELQSRVDLVCR